MGVRSRELCFSGKWVYGRYWEGNLCAWIFHSLTRRLACCPSKSGFSITPYNSPAHDRFRSTGGHCSPGGRNETLVIVRSCFSPNCRVCLLCGKTSSFQGWLCVCVCAACRHACFGVDYFPLPFLSCLFFFDAGK